MERLIELQKQAESRDKKLSAKANYLLGNAFYNMSYYGNSWMMVSYWWSVSDIYKEGKVNKNYFSLETAKAYYKKAMEASPTPSFAALNLRLMGICEKQNLYLQKEIDPNRPKDEYGYPADITVEDNEVTAYQELKKTYPKLYDSLMDGCSGWAAFLK